MLKTKKSPVVVHKEAGRVRFITLHDITDLDDLKDLQARIIESSPIVVQPAVRKAGIRRNRNHKPLNPNRRKMTVNVEESFIDIQKMNEKALKILAKRA